MTYCRHRPEAVGSTNSLDLPMARILITSGPTRQYLDPVRYLTERLERSHGKALAEAAIATRP